MDQEETITYLREMLKPLGVHDANDLAERLFLDHGLEAVNTHRAILLRDAVELCKTPLGGEDDMGLSWRIDSPRGMPWILIEFDYAGEQSQLSTIMPFTTDKIERDFSNPERHQGEGVDVINDYVMEQLDDDDRKDVWKFIQDDCQEYQRFLDSAASIKANCLRHNLLREAAHWGQLEAVEAALELEGAPNAPDYNSNTALHFAAAKGYTHLIAPLIQAGARVDEPGSMGATPLHMAARAAYAETCLALMAHGADPRAKDMMGRTPMELAKTKLIKDHEQAASL